MNVFCAKCQAATPHDLAADKNAEIVATCDPCGGFIKLPAGMSAAEVTVHLALHAEHNAGKVSAEEADAAVQASRDLIAQLKGEK